VGKTQDANNWLMEVTVDEKLIITVDLTRRLGPSKSGQNILIASSGGVVRVPNRCGRGHRAECIQGTVFIREPDPQAQVRQWLADIIEHSEDSPHREVLITVLDALDGYPRKLRLHAKRLQEKRAPSQVSQRRARIP